MLIGWHVKIAKIGILMHKIVKEKLKLKQVYWKENGFKIIQQYQLQTH